LNPKLAFLSSFAFSFAVIYIIFGGVSACVQEYLIEDGLGDITGIPNPPRLNDEFKIDVITQVAKKEIDVLWVIDNSCSMAEEQSTLVSNFEYFIKYFVNSNLDWRIGVTSTDMDSASIPGNHGILREVNGINFIDENTQNPIQIFSQMATLGTRGAGVEKGTGATFGAVTSHNGGFYRPSASLSIIIISDEEDHTTEPILPEFIDWLSNLKEDNNDVSFSSIVCLDEITLNDQACGRAPMYIPSVGSKYMSVTAAVGGMLWDIREYDWAPLLDELGLRAIGLREEFFLTEVPLENSIEVWSEQPDGMIYNFNQNFDFIYSQQRNSITFIGYLPPQYTKINIKYTKLSSYHGPLGEDSQSGD